MRIKKNFWRSMFTGMLVCFIILGILLLPQNAVTAHATAGISYIKADGTTATRNLSDTQSITDGLQRVSNYAGVTAKKLVDGWYYVEGEITLDFSVCIEGDVHVILKDGCTLNVTEGISVDEDKSLTIYGQSTGDNKGKLIADNSDNTYDAGIGNDNYDNTGKITINGGDITAKGGPFAAGIGGGYSGTVDDITINGGTVNAIGGDDGAGIGTGYDGIGGNITINGGTINATGGSRGAGIGTGEDGHGSGITITGGTITAVGGETAAGIGGGYRGAYDTITISGGQITANQTNRNSPGIGDGHEYSSDPTAISLSLSHASDYINVSAVPDNYSYRGTVTVTSGLGIYEGTATSPSDVALGSASDLPAKLHNKVLKPVSAIGQNKYLLSVPEHVLADASKKYGNTPYYLYTAGDRVTISIEDGYIFTSDVSVTGGTNPVSVTAYANGTFSFNMPAADTTVSADVGFAQYYVQFMANVPTGATVTGSMANQTFYRDNTQNMSPIGYRVEGYTFKEWSEYANGSGSTYANGAPVTNLTNQTGTTVKLYAQWEAVNDNNADWYALRNELLYAASGSTVKLEKDYSGTYADLGLEFGGKNLTLDLNGHIIDADKDGLDAVTVRNASLRIKDSAKTAHHSPAITYVDPVKGETHEIYGGVIKGKGKGVVVEEGTLVLESGTIAKCKSYAVCLNSGCEFEMTGGMVCGNESVGVYIDDNCEASMNGGEISGNYLGGVFSRVPIKLSGKVNISGNTSAGPQCDLCFDNDDANQIIIDGTLDPSSKIGIAGNGNTINDRAYNLPQTITSGISGNPAVAGVFFKDDYLRDYELAMYNGELVLATDICKVTFDSQGGTAVASQNVPAASGIGSSVTDYNGTKAVAMRPTNPTKKDYVFANWMKDGQVYNFSTPVTEDITLTAQWKKSLSSSGITISNIPDQVYKGKALTPVVTVKDGSKDITDQCVVTYSNNNKAGTATVTIRAKDSSTSYAGTIKKTFLIKDDASEPKAVTVSYISHIQNIGWNQGYVKNGTPSGTSGKSYRLEGIKIKVDGDPNLGIQYTTHVQDYGWMGWSSNDEMSGTEGEAKRLEAIKIKLTGKNKDLYDVYYRVHAQNIGWMNWAKNGAAAGTAGYAYRLEAIQIVVVKKGVSVASTYENVTAVTSEAYRDKGNKGEPEVANGEIPNVTYRTHVQNVGWQAWKTNGGFSGTSGRSLRLEGINVKLSNKDYTGGIRYKTHIQNIGWEKNWRVDGEMSGTSGRSLRLEAIEIELYGEMAKHYDIYYRVHAQDVGWMGWAANGSNAGTAGYARRLEGIQIVLVPKGSAAPLANFGNITSVTSKPYLCR